MRLSVILVSIFLSIQTLFSIEIEKEYIYEESYFIQVCALSKESNIERVKSKLMDYHLYLEEYNNLKRIYIVNIITKEELNDTLKDIQKIYPEAFISKGPKNLSVDETHKAILKESQETIYEKVEPTLEKNRTIELNSQTILKTRKSFL